MNATTEQEEEQIKSIEVEGLSVGETDLGESEVLTGEMFDFAEYELEVGRTTATDEHTDEQYTLWRVEGRPVGTTADGFREVSPTLPEAVMGVCESLRRNGDGL